MVISIHAPLRGRPVAATQGQRLPRISIHAPLRGRPCTKRRKSRVGYFNPRPLAGATDFPPPCWCWWPDFNPRPLAGATVRRDSLSASSASVFFRESQFTDLPSPIFRCLFLLFASPSRLQHHGSFWVIGPFGSQVLDFVLIRVSQVVEPQAVVVFVDEGFQFSLQQNELGLVQQAFEYGILYSLSMGHAAFGHFPQPGSSSRSFGIYIVGYQDQHGFTSPKMPDIHPDLLSAIWPGAEPGHKGKVPKGSFPSKRDVPVFPASVPATG